MDLIPNTLSERSQSQRNMSYMIPYTWSCPTHKTIPWKKNQKVGKLTKVTWRSSLRWWKSCNWCVMGDIHLCICQKHKYITPQIYYLLFFDIKSFFFQIFPGPELRIPKTKLLFPLYECGPVQCCTRLHGLITWS